MKKGIMALTKIHKIIAKKGYCSTRKAEELIREKRVFVNEELAHIGQLIGEETIIKIDGKEIKDESQKEITYILNKPIGYECSTKTFKNINKSVFSLLPKNSKLHTIGRLDVKTSGLLILTTNGKLTQDIIHPSAQILKTYLVRINQKLSKEDETIITSKGIKIDENISKAYSLTFKGEKKGSFEYEISVYEGKKHIIRKFFGELNYIVKSLQRIKIGELNLFKLNLKEGEYKEIKDDILLKLIHKK